MPPSPGGPEEEGKGGGGGGGGGGERGTDMKSRRGRERGKETQIDRCEED